MSSLAKNLKRKLDKNDLNDNNLALLDVNHDKTEVLKISFNGGAAIEVNKEKLLKNLCTFKQSPVLGSLIIKKMKYK